ncbi:MAG: riboflavin synthase [Chloroflexi bacterium]|nr:riboflavin synthase [Chloroflexota bacterium]MBV9597087.1 riboflavin synthase [Chloroflexota bacterium]
MFTGIVEELATVRRIIPHASGARVEIAATTVLDDVHVGDSISLNGCCLTVVEIGGESYEVDVVEESLRVTTLGGLQPGDRVNLERSVRMADRLGGHLVQGHVDATATLAARERLADGSMLLRFEAPHEVLRYVVYKGSIAVDGISLTVAGVDDAGFSIAVIPHTQVVTTLGFRQVGDKVNLETDVLARYVERLLLQGRS